MSVHVLGVLLVFCDVVQGSDVTAVHFSFPQIGACIFYDHVRVMQCRYRTYSCHANLIFIPN